MTNEELNDKINNVDKRQDSLEATVKMYITMANAERAEDRARMRQLDEKFERLNERMDETVKYIQNLVTVAIAGIAALVVAVILK